MKGIAIKILSTNIYMLKNLSKIWRVTAENNIEQEKIFHMAQNNIALQSCSNSSCRVLITASILLKTLELSNPVWLKYFFKIGSY